MWADLRQAVRGLRREPVFTLVAVASIALAVGVNATIFGVIDGLWLRPPGIAEPDRLTWIFSTTKEESKGGFSWPEYTELRDRAKMLDSVVALGRRGTSLYSGDGPPEMLLVNVVSTNFFSALGVRAHAGRLFTPSDEAQLNQQPTVVLGHDFWRRRYGADPSIVGRTIPLGRKSASAVLVLGVLPESFRDMWAAADRDVWFPVQTWTQLSTPKELEPRNYRWFELLGVRNHGADMQAVRSELATVAASWATEYPQWNGGRSATGIGDLSYRLEAGGVGSKALFGIVLLVVLITCVNVANLLLARAAKRAREIAVRVALGASRLKVMRQFLTESALLGLLGGLCSVAVTAWLLTLLPALMAAPPGMRSAVLFRMDMRVFAFTMLSALVTVMLFGVAPARTAAKTDITPAFKADSGRAAANIRRSITWNVLIAGQIAVAVVLLCTTAAVLRSFLETLRADLGFERKPLVMAWFSFGDYGRENALAVTDRIKSIPGVKDVAIAFRAPLSLSGGGMARPVAIPGRTRDPREGLPEVKLNTVSSNYFRVMGTKLLRGREFTEADQTAAGEPAAIVNEQFARHFFGTVDAVGRTIQVGGADAAASRIVGVVQNAAINMVREQPEPYLYQPYFRAAYGDMTMIVEARTDAAPVVASMRTLFRGMDKRLYPQGLTTMEALIAYKTRTSRMTAALSGVLAILGVLLTAIGVYGVVAYGVAQRTHEIGIRMALGASRAGTVRLIVGDGLRMLATGITAGVPLALIATASLRPLLAEVGGLDWGGILLAVAVLTITVVTASAGPAMRAAAVNPASALRD